MMKRDLVFLCLLSATAPFLGGFMFNSVADLAFMSVNVVDRYDQGEIPTPSASAYTGLMSDQEMVRYRLANPYGERPHELLLKAEFKSTLNLSRFANEGGYNLGNTSFFCNRPKDNVFLSSSYVYWRGVRLGNHDGDPIQQSGESTRQPITYYIFLGVARQAVTPANPQQVSYDLRQKPEDICFYLRGGDGTPFGFKSNTVTIPKEAIAAALQKVPPGIGGQ
jgi:hypothetical protein